MGHVTQEDLYADLRLDATDAAAHARCGGKAKCRRDALTRCDADLDAIIALGVFDVRPPLAGAEPGG